MGSSGLAAWHAHARLNIGDQFRGDAAQLVQRRRLDFKKAFVLGQIAQGWLGNWVRAHRQLATWFDRSSIAIAVYVAFSGAVEQRFWTKVDGLGWLWLAGATALLLVIAHGGAWLLGGLLRLDRPNRITMLFAGAQKSIAMGAPLASVLFPPAVAGIVLLPILIYHLAQLVLAAPLAARLASAR